ncbi:MAG: class I SAM-dependent methyltransferase [Anaerolineae bacterium]|nr:class I SAM-dependent methyltransferase [Anaerolineae bacterium]
MENYALRTYWEQPSSVQHWNRDVEALDLATRLAWADVLRRNLNLGRRHAKVLDVATGTGLFALISAELNWQTTAADISAAMLQQAMINADSRGYAIDFVQADVVSLDFADGAFDAIIGRFALSCMDQPVTALREWYRVLKPGGRLLLVEDAADTSSHITDPLIRWHFGDTPAYGKLYQELAVQNGADTPAVELTNLITRAGFHLLVAGQLSGQLQQQLEWLHFKMQRPYLLVVAEKPERSS